MNQGLDLSTNVKDTQALCVIYCQNYVSLPWYWNIHISKNDEKKEIFTKPLSMIQSKTEISPKKQW